MDYLDILMAILPKVTLHNMVATLHNMVATLHNMVVTLHNTVATLHNTVVILHNTVVILLMAILHKVTLLMVMEDILLHIIQDHQLLNMDMGLTWGQCWPGVQRQQLQFTELTSCHMVLTISAMEDTPVMDMATMVASSSMASSNMVSLESMGNMVVECLEDIMESSRSGSNGLLIAVFIVIKLVLPYYDLICLCSSCAHACLRTPPIITGFGL